MRMLRCLALVLGLLACSDGASSLSSGSLEGEWTFLFEEGELDCVPEIGGTFELRVLLDDATTDLLSGDVYVTGRWYAPGDSVEWSAVQGIFMSGKDSVELTLWGRQMFEGAPRILIDGDIDRRPGVTGTWSEVGGDVLYEGGCSGAVDGQRIS